MKEIDFKDRVPQQPGRVKMIPVQGMANTYDMTRADNPIEEGTPINRATLYSMVHSRLTGRYYKPSVTQVSKNLLTNLNVSPIPQSGWVYESGNMNIARSGSYMVQSDSNNGSGEYAGEAFSSSGWQSAYGTESSLIISHTTKIKVRNVSFMLAMVYPSRVSSFKIQGSNNGVNWTNLYTATSVNTNATQTYTLTSTGNYSYYRLLFTSTSNNRVTVSGFKYSLYDINTYENVFTMLDGMPSYFTAGQRVMLETPDTVMSDSVISNTFNEISVNTILGSSRHYELVYNGVSFDAMEV